MAFSFISSGAFASQGTLVTSQVVPSPTGPISIGDLIVVVLIIYQQGPAITTPDGSWFGTPPNLNNKAGQAIYYKYSNGPEPANYTFNSSLSAFMAGISLQFTGAAFESISGAFGVNPSLTSASVTPIHTNDLLIVTYTANGSLASMPLMTLDSNLSSIVNTSSSSEGFGIAIGQVAAPAAGIASAQYTTTISSANANGIFTATSMLICPPPPSITVFNNIVDGY
jgi:hypothetical protein